MNLNLNLPNLIARAKVVLSTFVTWLVVAAGILTVVAADLTELLGTDSAVIVALVRVLAWIGAAIAIIRKVTPVLDSATGLLPVDRSIPVTSRELQAVRLLEDHRNLHP